MRQADVLPLLLLLACAGPDSTQGGPIPVTVVVAEPGTVSRTVMAPAWLEAGDEAILQVSVPGRVTGVHVSEGDSVRAGTVLISMATDRAHAAELSASLAAVSAAEAMNSYADGNLRRAAGLFESGSATPSEYEKALSDALFASAALEGARASHALALDGLSRGTLSAPFSGMVTRVWAREGNPAAGPLIALSGGGALRCRVLLAHSALPWIRPGLPAFFTTSHYPGMVFQGLVHSSASTVDPATSLVPATVSFADSSGMLLPGMSGMVSISLELHQAAISLPRNAFVHMSDGTLQVMVVRDGLAWPVVPVTGFEHGFRTLVSSGVSPGDTVVLLGNRLLSPGDSVRVVGR